MINTWAERLRATARTSFVGRDAQIDRFRAMLDDRDPARVMYVHGPGGIGKTMLLRRYADIAEAAGFPVRSVDCRTVAPTTHGLWASAAASGWRRRTVLLIDSFELCHPLAGWLWQTFLPHLSAEVRVVIACRRPPDPLWAADPGWTDLLRVIALPWLSDAEASSILDRHGVPPASRHRLLRHAAGYPLALALATRRAPPVDPSATLLGRVVGVAPSAAHQLALDVCAHAHHTTAGLLREVTGDGGEELFDWLREQPFIEAGRHGLVPHEPVRRHLDDDLRWRDPEGYRKLHARIRRHFTGRLRTVTGAAELPIVAALTHLHHRAEGSGPHLRSWPHDGLREEPYHPDDRAALMELAASAEGPAGAEAVAFWSDRQPEAFHVHRHTVTGRLTGFVGCLLLNGDDDASDTDPVAGDARRHLRDTADLRPGERFNVVRFLVSPQRYYQPSPATDLGILRVTAQLFTTPRLAATYVAIPASADWHRFLDYFGFTELPGLHQGRRLYTHDWRTVPVSTWSRTLDQRVLDGAAPWPPPLAVLTADAFTQGVRQALRVLDDPVRLAASPLLRTRVVAAEHGDPVTGLRRVIERAAAELGADRRLHDTHEALRVAYFGRRIPYAVAAERLGVAESTFKRRLRAAVDGICRSLWQQELDGMRP
ncbi:MULTISPECIES: ATP-binding protein [Actinoplanes]|uniref:ATP-binding protein n=1 Tax=Actinoplanes TaxID=1865 RepID=UPI0005F2E646|nr:MULTISPECIES: ATP-binding protein [Actinoplanes]GLY02329.1 hypothetical protein Acsp01_27080 [Actinoplanes sp. NBRC 101535]